LLLEALIAFGSLTRSSFDAKFKWLQMHLHTESAVQVSPSGLTQIQNSRFSCRCQSAKSVNSEGSVIEPFVGTATPWRAIAFGDGGRRAVTKSARSSRDCIPRKRTRPKRPKIITSFGAKASSIKMRTVTILGPMKFTVTYCC